MPDDIYWGTGSPHSWYVLPGPGLGVKGLDYDSRLPEFSQEQYRSPDMRVMNPRGQLPVLKDGDISMLLVDRDSNSKLSGSKIA